jgi:hypothetical protein
MPASALPSDGPWVERWLSTARFSVYVRVCGGDRTRAVALYQWNAAAGQAFGLDLGHLEVALRNAYDVAITARWRGAEHWLLDQAGPVRRPLVRHGIDHNARRRSQIAEACDRAGGPGASPGKVIAELPFGFWRFLTSASRQNSLWMPYLRYAFPRRTARVAVDVVVTELNQVRNRIAHHEPLLARDLAADHAQLLHLVGLLNPQLAMLIRCTTTVPEQLRRRP